MGDDKAQGDFPDAGQRFAFCAAQWERKDAWYNTDMITKLDEEQRIAYGWFSVIEEAGRPVVDSQGDVITEATLVKAVHEFVLDSRAGKLMHQGRRVADIVESVVLTKDLQNALGIDVGRVGWFGAMKFRDDKVWDRVKNGELRAFSIGGTGSRSMLDGI